MTLSEREIGMLQQRVQTLEHQRRNDRTIVNIVEGELGALREDFSKFKHRAYSVAACTAGFAGLVAWLVEILGALG